MQFDLYLSNPPYQAPTDSDKGNTQGGYWNKFLKLSINHLNDGGYVCFISPHSWIGMGGYNTPSFKLNAFKEYDVLSIDFDCRKHFPGIGIDICSYTIRKTRTNTETQIKTVNEKFAVDLKSLKAMPYQVSKMSVQILNKMLIANAGKSYSFSEGFDKNAGKPKVYVLSSRFGSLKFIRIDWTGDTQDKYRISMPINQSDVGCESYFQSKLFAFYFKIAGGKSGMSQTGILQNAPVIDLTRTWTDQEIYAHFGLTEEEIQYIEASVA